LELRHVRSLDVARIEMKVKNKEGFFDPLRISQGKRNDGRKGGPGAANAAEGR
jgi:hypothetical protein